MNTAELGFNIARIIEGVKFGSIFRPCPDGATRRTAAAARSCQARELYRPRRVKLSVRAENLIAVNSPMPGALLEYAPRPPGRRRRWFRRSVLLTASLLLVGTLEPWGHGVWSRAAFRYHLHNCERYTAP